MAFRKTRLSVNINKIATLRNARGKNQPNLLYFARIALMTEALGITVHPRPDERHIRREDVFQLKRLLKDFPEKELNVEGFPSSVFLELVEKAIPEQCTLVPDPPHVLTSNAGWDFVKHQSFLKSSVESLKAKGIRISLFLDPKLMDEGQYQALEDIRPHRVEFYTESYANESQSLPKRQSRLDIPSHTNESPSLHTNESRSLPKRQNRTLSLYRKCADRVLDLGIELNAGHDLNRDNLLALLRALPEIKEVSIGQALVSDALEMGFQSSIESYLQIIDKAFFKS